MSPQPLHFIPVNPGKWLKHLGCHELMDKNPDILKAEKHDGLLQRGNLLYSECGRVGNPQYLCGKHGVRIYQVHHGLDLCIRITKGP